MTPHQHRNHPVEKALWFVESHFSQDITLDDVAEVAGVSRYHLSRAFGAAMGFTLTRYLRARRLTEAAKRLSAGAPDILSVALEFGYGSHEAFTRAFRDQFGVTPESVRASGNIHQLNLQEATRMDPTLSTPLAPPQFKDGGVMLIAGMSERYDGPGPAGIPSQWQRFVPHLGHIPGQIGEVTYGVCCNCDGAGTWDYICGVEVSDFSRIPSDWTCLRIQPQRYAVFQHQGHISSIRNTFNSIFNEWFPASGCKPSGAPEFERYGADFNGATGFGTTEIWIPIQS